MVFERSQHEHVYQPLRLARAGDMEIGGIGGVAFAALRVSTMHCRDVHLFRKWRSVGDRQH